jgi:hypothetical protein
MKSFLKIIFIISLCVGIVPFMNYCKKEKEQDSTTDQYQEIIRTAINNSQSGSDEALNQAEQDIIELLREQAGARTALGDQADLIFQQIDKAKATSVEDIQNQSNLLHSSMLDESPKMTINSKLIMMKESLASSNYQKASGTMGAVGLLMGRFFGFANERRDMNGNSIIPMIESEMTLENITFHTYQKSKLIGAKMEVEVEMIASITQPIVYEERIKGNFIGEYCPDAQGNVPFQFSLRCSVAKNGGGEQLGLEGQVIGHVNDEGKLASFDMQSSGSGAMQPMVDANDNWGTTNKYVELKYNLALSQLNPNESTGNISIIRASSETDKKYINKIIAVLVVLNTSLPREALNLAQLLWTDGYCVAVQVPEIGATNEKTVLVNSETPFTAIVKHKFENIELNVPVIAKLIDGQVSVTPAGSKVNAPATFTYKAADTKGQTATVNLETISKRGIAKLDVKFKTGGGGWKVDDTYLTLYSGVVCDLGSPFSILAQTNYVYSYNFTPTTTEAGNVMFDVTYNYSEFLDYHDTFTGTYKVLEIGPNRLELDVIGTFCSTEIINNVPADPFCFEYVYSFVLTPLDTNECNN